MLRIGIVGADTELGGDLIRLLLTHPEVEMVSMMAPGKKGLRLSSVHYGLIGETDLGFTDTIDYENVNVLFILNKIPYPLSPENVKIIDLTHCHSESESSPLNSVENVGETSRMEFGLGEVNRKSLVRGASKAYIPQTVASVGLIALAPLALHLLLNDDIMMEITAPENELTDANINDALKQIKHVLGNIQTSYTGEIHVEKIVNSSSDGIRIKISLPSEIASSDIKKIYEGIYDDHNFTFLTDAPVGMEEVAGTNRCIIYVDKENGKIGIDIVADASMRGKVGDAIHVMNLLCGLHEKTGLYLPAK